MYGESLSPFKIKVFARIKFKFACCSLKLRKNCTLWRMESILQNIYKIKPNKSTKIKLETFPSEISFIIFARRKNKRTLDNAGNFVVNCSTIIKIYYCFVISAAKPLCFGSLHLAVAMDVFIAFKRNLRAWCRNWKSRFSAVNGYGIKRSRFSVCAFI